MYLKSIEVHGFKSFANKIVFDFHNGITGIVGPNGSGKSNVADAVRWVLGEQSAKQLRGASMQDVIFAGTENRKPLSYAYVAITLDNSDHTLPVEYEEVTISRRVYRSGESEYLLNGTSCRLKDVNELFYDTGIGKEGYSIIGQGQIEKILNGKPEERRELFDEAAGIVKYKRRKAAAQKKLQDERENLIRVNDILSELERQVGPLERQAETAKIYLKKKEELKQYDVNLFLQENKRINEQLVLVGEKFAIADTQMKKNRFEFDEIKSSYEKMEHDMERMEQTIGETKDRLSQMSIQKGEVLSEIRIMEEQIKMAISSREDLKQRMETVLLSKQDKEKEQKLLLKEKEELTEELLGVEQVYKEASDKLLQIQKQMDESKSQIEKGKTQVIDLLNQKATIKANQQRYEAMLEQIHIRKSQLTQRLLQRKSEEQDNVAEIKKQEEELKEVVFELEKRSEDIALKETELTKKNEKIFALKNEADTCRIEWQKEQSKLESLRNIAERYDGYGNSIRKVMESKKKYPGIVGVVADLITVDKKYETAIEIALSGNIQNIVTKDEQTAKELITFLKVNKFGRATFLPLTSVFGKEQSKNEKFLTEKGVLGFANTLVKTDAVYQNIMEYLLGRVLVMENIDDAIALAKKSHYSLHMVTLDGEYFSPGGSMAGGAFKNSSNLLGRKREIETLEETIQSLQAKMNEHTKTMELLTKEKQQQKEFLEQQKEILGQNQIDKNTKEIHLTKLKERQAESHDVYANLLRESQELDQQITEILQMIADIEQQLKKAKIEEEQIEDSNLKLQKELEEQLKQSEDFVANSSKIQLQKANQKQKLEFLLQNLERISNEIEKISDEIQNMQKQEEESFKISKDKQLEVEHKRNSIEGADGAFLQMEEELKQYVSTKEEMNVKYKGFFQRREEISEQISQLDKEIYRLTSQKEKFEETCEYYASHIWEEYELTPSKAKELEDESLGTLADLRKQMHAIKDDIRNLGNVNVNAIEDFKEMNERYQFLKTQHDDLIEAEATLLKIIEELDTGMRQQFTEKFAQIQIEFDHVFKEMFGGGKGTLELVEEEDILECGIKIIAQPPGKKLQNMMQLSGGEKALTAIALLFAIQNLKPSPFCLLDEIEAALDDSNVERFAKYLHKLIKNTQFIVITHRRGTMNAADRLYGITMQEKGVSTLVSVNLIETELDK